MLLYPDVFTRRIAKVREYLRSLSTIDEEPAAAVLTSSRDVYWLTGLRTQGNPLLHCAIVASDTDSVIVITRKLEITNVRLRAVCAPNVIEHPYGESDHPHEILSSVLQRFSHVVFDESHMNISLYNDINANMAGELTTTPVSYVSVLRMQKDQVEMLAMTRAAEAAAASMKKVTQHLHVGMRETDITSIACKTVHEHGAETATYPHFVHAGPRRGCMGHCMAESGETITNGRLVFVELGASFSQYHGACMHTLFTGDRSDLPRDVVTAERAVGSALNEMCAIARPGNSAANLACIGKYCLASAIQCGWVLSDRMGYSIGVSAGEVDWGEANMLSIHEGSSSTLKAGMTLHIIPYLMHPLYGTVAFSRCIVVKEDGGHALAERVAPLPAEITCVGADPMRIDTFLGVRVRQQLSGSGLAEHVTPMLTFESSETKVQQLGINELYIKDESTRGGISQSSFKMLGAGFAVLQSLKRAFKYPTDATWSQVKDHLLLTQDKITLCAATAGNHGAAVAWAASEFGQHAEIFVPAGSSVNRIKLIKRRGGNVTICTTGYDETVRIAQEYCEDRHDCIFVQDTEPAYPMVNMYNTVCDNKIHIDEVVWSCKAGYSVLGLEIIEQCSPPPTHVFLQVGVGSFASAIMQCLGDAWGDQTRFVAVEPKEAACLHTSLQNRKCTSVQAESPAYSSALDCHTVSPTAWGSLRHDSDGSVVCDASSILESKYFIASLVDSGDSGAVVPMGCLLNMSQVQRLVLGITNDSRVLCINTEGETNHARHTEYSGSKSLEGVEVFINPTRSRL